MMQSNITRIEDDLRILLLEAGHITYSGQYNLRLFF